MSFVVPPMPSQHFSPESFHFVAMHRFSIQQSYTWRRQLIHVLIYRVMCRWFCYPTTWYVLNVYFEVRLWQTWFSCAPSWKIFMQQTASTLRIAICTVIVMVVYIYNNQVAWTHHLNLWTLSHFADMWFRFWTFRNMHSCYKVCVQVVYTPKNCPAFGLHPCWEWRFSSAPPGTF